MNELKIINHNGTHVVDSREVAEMIGKQHKDLLESIRSYEQFLLSGEFRSVDFFISSTYQDSTGRTLPCYLLTRKGCDMVANKMTGEKGVLFTAAYVTKFEEMEKALQPKLPQTYAAALRELADVWEQNQLMLPKAEYFDALVDRNLLTSFRDTAKELKIRERAFINWLIEKHYIYRDTKGNLKPYAEYAPSLFELKEQTKGKWAGTQALVTPRGRETFRLLLKGQLQPV